MNEGTKTKLDLLRKAAERIEKTKKIFMDDGATDEQKLEAVKFLDQERNASHDETSLYHRVRSLLKKELEGESKTAQEKVLREIDNLDKEVAAMLLEDETILPGNACKHFVRYCNRARGIIKMEVVTRSGAHEFRTFEIGGNIAWDIVKELVTADEYPITITALHTVAKNRDLTSTFNAANGGRQYGGANEFRRYIHTTELGSKAKYELRQTTDETTTHKTKGKTKSRPKKHS